MIPVFRATELETKSAMENQEKSKNGKGRFCLNIDIGEGKTHG